MGTTDTEVERLKQEYKTGWFDVEKPLHRVEITEEFYLGKFLVTQAQWNQLMGNNPSSFKYEGDEAKQYPVENISWESCQKFLVKINDKTGKTYRLPSEAEWEYACRAGTQTPFYFGKTLSMKIANYDANYIYGRGQRGVCREKTTEVGSFPANDFGLYDMHGNLWEWCEDEWEDNYQQQRLPNDAKVARGGSWDASPVICRSAFRFNPDYRYHTIGHIGFRVVCVP